MKVKVTTAITITYEVNVTPEAYPGCETPEDVATTEHRLIEEEGDYLIAMMDMTGETTVESVTATEIPLSQTGRGTEQDERP